ncbi:MAG: DUF898 domain-containing protein [Betaproteobacteria bacterium]|nr:DUF898 domain-containing protein [Betaproteobacteria bacterium]
MDDPSGVTQRVGAAPSPFEFTGTGSEYFRIWIVNLALTLITLGIYSASAKVRRLQYFYRNTSLLGNSFDYHGDPMAILKGRLIGVGLLMLYNGAAYWSMALAVTVFLLLIAVMPWLIQRSITFKLFNSSYRGLRLRFNGSVGDAYNVFLGWPVLVVMTFGLLLPLAHQRIKAYQHNHSAYGTAPFNFSADVGSFYVVYFKLLGMILAPVFLIGVTAASYGLFAAMGSGERDPVKLIQNMMQFFVLLAVLYLGLFLIIGPWYAARTQNLVWNHTALGAHRFSSRVRARDLLILYVTNFILIVLTLGLFKPFADIRLARYRLTHMALQPQGNLDEFFAHEQQAVNALGEETANIFDVDISF